MEETNDCAECGFRDESVAPEEIAPALRRFGTRYRAPLTRFLPGENPDAVLRGRPDHRTWSALEYAAHVRDVFGWYDERVRRSLAEDRPVAEGPGPDEAAAEGAYNELDPAAVADELAANAEGLAATYQAVPADGWHRVHIRNGVERSVLFTGRRAVHEGHHHLLDIGRVLRAVREQAKGGG